tara:strand:+ start:1073 stop:2332 length:1260 start_codon:yes stop_codon:yes gene_type:complete
MSYLDTINNLSQNISARENHIQSMMDMGIQAQARGLEDKFKNNIDAWAQGADILGTASGAYHMGRHVYKKFQNEGLKSALSSAKEEVENLKNKRSGRPASDEAKNPSEEAGTSEATGGQAPPENQGNIRSGQATEEAGADNSGTVQPSDSTGEGATSNQNPSRQPEEGGGERAEGEESGDLQGSTPTQAQVDAQAPAGDSGAAVGGEGDNPFRISNYLGEDELQDMGRKGTALQSGGAEAETATSVPDNVRVVQPGASDTPQYNNTVDFQSGAKPTEPASSGDLTATSQAGVDQIPDASTLSKFPADTAPSEGGGALLDKTGVELSSETGEMVGKTVGRTLGDSVLDALPEVSTVLDAIPVVGEIGSVVVGLVDLFRGIFHQDPSQKDLNNIRGQQSIGISSSGVDASSIKQSLQAGGN